MLFLGLRSMYVFFKFQSDKSSAMNLFVGKVVPNND